MTSCHMLIIGPCTDRPSPLQFMINPISRRILRDLHYHVQAFAIFGTRCGSPLPVHPAFGQTGQIDLASTQLAQADLREGFHAAGVSIGALSKIYDSFEELTTTEAGGKSVLPVPPVLVSKLMIGQSQKSHLKNGWIRSSSHTPYQIPPRASRLE